MFQYRLWISDGGFIYLLRLQSDITKQQVKNEELEDRNKRLEARVEEYREGQDILEEQARSQLGMVKKDETFIHVIESGKSKSE